MQTSRNRLILGILILFGLILLAYQPALTGGFVWDDENFVHVREQYRGLDGLVNIWLEPTIRGQYYPLTFTTFWVEYHFWELNPHGYHTVNIFLHGLNVLLIWIICSALRLRGAFFIAALFAVHPVHVESVAWIAERKNVLSGLFYLLSLLFYLKAYGNFQKQTQGRQGFKKHYILALFLFTCALLSKTVTCSLPLVILLIMWWKQHVITRKDLLALVPFFVLGVVMGLTTVNLEIEYTGAMGAYWDFTFIERCLIAGRAFWFYIVKLIVPYKLVFIYPRWNIDGAQLWQYVFPLGVVLSFFFLWTTLKKWGRGPIVAICFYFITIFPALGFFNIFPMKYSFVADHFQYLASLGILILLTQVVFILDNVRRNRRVLNVIAIVIIGLFVFLSRQQAKSYENILIFYEDILKKNPDCVMAHVNLGRMHSQIGNLDLSYQHYKKAIEKDPRERTVYLNLGVYFSKTGDEGRAIENYEKAIEIDPFYAKAYFNLGVSLAKQGQFLNAIEVYKQAVTLTPELRGAYNNLGILYDKLGQGELAIDAYQSALALDMDNTETLINMGAAYMNKGELENALRVLNQALAIDAQQPIAYFNRSRLYHKQKLYARSLQDALQAKSLGLALDEKYISLLKQLAK